MISLDDWILSPIRMLLINAKANVPLLNLLGYRAMTVVPRNHAWVGLLVATLLVWCLLVLLIQFLETAC